MNTVGQLIKALQETPDEIEFPDVIKVIDASYTYTPTRFVCGAAVSEAGGNEGSCKILGFGRMNNLSVAHTLALFGRFYREDVLGNPQGQDHANIRNFIKNGWDGVSFDTDPLS